MEKKKEDLGRLAPYYQEIISPGYETGTAVYLLLKKDEQNKAEAAAMAAKELYKNGGIKALKDKFAQLKLPGILSYEKQEVKSKEQEPLIPFVLGKPRNRGQELQMHEFSADSDMDDSIAETMRIQGPLSKAARSYLRMMAKNMRDMDTAIDMAVLSGNSELVESLNNQWNTCRKDMMIYLGKSKIRVFPMHKKDKQKAIDKAEANEYKQEKSKGITHPKTRGLARQRVRSAEED